MSTTPSASSVSTTINDDVRPTAHGLQVNTGSPFATFMQPWCARCGKIFSLSGPTACQRSSVRLFATKSAGGSGRRTLPHADVPGPQIPSRLTSVAAHTSQTVMGGGGSSARLHGAGTVRPVSVHPGATRGQWWKHDERLNCLRAAARCQRLRCRSAHSSLQPRMHLSLPPHCNGAGRRGW